MRKKLLAVIFPIVIAIVCSVAVWANEPSVPCDKCAKADKVATAADKDAQAAPGCDKCAKMKAAETMPCGGCDKMKAAAAMPCGGCDKNAQDAKAAQECAKLKAEGKPCGEKGCDKQAKAGAAVQGCDKCPKMKGAEGKPCGEKGCDKSAKMQQTEAKPCCDKSKQ